MITSKEKKIRLLSTLYIGDLFSPKCSEEGLKIVRVMVTAGNNFN